MEKSKYWFLGLCFIFFACKDDSEVATSHPNETTVWPAKPINITLPEVVFTDAEKIRDGVPSYAIYDQVINLVDATPANASIYISIYAFQDFKPLVDALNHAHSRAVSVHVMVDMSSHNEDLVLKNSAMIKGLDKGIVIVSGDNDAGSIAINHNKFILFSELSTEEGLIENVILQTSHNFTESDTERIQDAVILSHEGLYQAYLKYWQDMQALSEGGMKNFEYREYQDPEAGITAYFHPKRKDGEAYGDDTIIALLDDITDPSASTIKIAMSGWSNSRVSIVEKLNELLTQGATIEVITKSSIGPEVFAGLKTLEQKGAFIKIYNMEDPDQQRINIHAKFMLIEGMWKGLATNLVLTGSQNFSINALRYNNETSLLFKDHQFYESYNSYFNVLKTIPGVCCP